MSDTVKARLLLAFVLLSFTTGCSSRKHPVVEKWKALNARAWQHGYRPPGSKNEEPNRNVSSSDGTLISF